MKAKLPITIEFENQGSVDSEKNWSVGGRTSHVEIRQYFLRELKEQGLLLVKWCPGETNESDLFTKNLGGSSFERRTRVFCNGD